MATVPLDNTGTVGCFVRARSIVYIVDSSHRHTNRPCVHLYFLLKPDFSWSRWVQGDCTHSSSFVIRVTFFKTLTSFVRDDDLPQSVCLRRAGHFSCSEPLSSSLVIFILGHFVQVHSEKQMAPLCILRNSDWPQQQQQRRFEKFCRSTRYVSYLWPDVARVSNSNIAVISSHNHYIAYSKLIAVRKIFLFN